MNVVAHSFACAVLALGCGGSERLTTPAGSDPVALPDPAPEPVPVAPLPPGDPPADAGALAPGFNAFGIDLWKALGPAHGGNFALSPASVALAFGMVEAGARADTLAALRKALHLTLSDEDVHQATGALLGRWNAAGAPYTLRVANRLFGEQTTAFEPPFLTLMKDVYGAPLAPMDFIHAPEPARVGINDWVAKATEQKILDLLPPGSIDPDSRLVLVNAVYFKGQWALRFDKGATHQQGFHAPDALVDVPMMHQRGSFKFARLADATLVELPYVGDKLAMTLVLPGEGTSLAALEGTLSDATLRRWDAGLAKVDEVDVALPRFKLEGDSFSLKPSLVELGLGAAFAPGAHFEGMTALEPFYIDDAFHKVFVEVNEEGTEAAAATAVVMRTESAHIPPSFIADRPFLFFLRDVGTGHVLFMGRVTNPLG